jgi:hypothetical protein
MRQIGYSLEYPSIGSYPHFVDNKGQEDRQGNRNKKTVETDNQCISDYIEKLKGTKKSGEISEERISPGTSGNTQRIPIIFKSYNNPIYRLIGE